MARTRRGLGSGNETIHVVLYIVYSNSSCDSHVYAAHTRVRTCTRGPLPAMAESVASSSAKSLPTLEEENRCSTRS